MCCYGRFVWLSGAVYLENMSGLRKQWEMQGEQGYRPFNPTPVKARPRTRAAKDHSYHLLMLQERNRLLKRLSQKGQREVEMERKEQGFSLYLNGANTAHHHHHHHHQRLQPRSSAMTDDQQHPSLQSQSRPSQTAGGVEKESPDQEGRSRTAPSRKSWSHETVVLRTEDGQTLPVSAPGIVSGCYDDDFESSAAEMSEEETVTDEIESGEEREGERESSEAHSTEDEELTESLQELSLQQCSSVENTLTTSGSHQDSLVEGRQSSGEAESRERRDSIEEESRSSVAEGGEEVEDGDGVIAEQQEEQMTQSAATATSTLVNITERVRRLDQSEQRKLLEILSSETTPTTTPTTTPHWLQPQPEYPHFLPPLLPPNKRPVSTRSTGLRGEIATRTLVSETNESSLWRHQSTAGGVMDSRAGSRPYRYSSGRTSGIRGQLLSRAHSDHAIGTSWSGDQPGVRGALHSPGHTSSEPDILHCPHSRPHTVVLKPGPNRMEPGSLPTWETEINDSDSLPLLTNESCDSAHWPHPSPDLNESLASLSFFDHTHQGQLGTTTDDGLLKTFLTEYKETKTEGSLFDPRLTETEPLPPSPHSEGPQREEERGYSTPELPTGQELVLNLLTTWGDQFYIGLTGLEIFTASGERAAIDQISADPADINVLPEYSGDPRVVSNLLDGVHPTKDDLHMWLAPFTPSQPHTITISLSSPTSLAVVRVWNYNKSRIHSYRGVRDMEMWLDQQLIFRGEIRRASGGILDRASNCGETILFTTDEDVLFRVGLHDNQFQEEIARCHGNSRQSHKHDWGEGEEDGQ